MIILYLSFFQAQNPEWGLRDVYDLEKLAKSNSMNFDAMFDMPANNKTLVWLKLTSD